MEKLLRLSGLEVGTGIWYLATSTSLKSFLAASVQAAADHEPVDLHRVLPDEIGFC